jgi:hypothetical protein
MRKLKALKEINILQELKTQTVADKIFKHEAS